jgi:hypothetical protein
MGNDFIWENSELVFSETLKSYNTGNDTIEKNLEEV